MTSVNDSTHNADSEIDRLAGELDKAQAYEQKLRQIIVDVRNALASGHVEIALSMLNQALSYIDDQTDVVTPHSPR